MRPQIWVPHLFLVRPIPPLLDARAMDATDREGSAILVFDCHWNVEVLPRHGCHLPTTARGNVPMTGEEFIGVFLRFPQIHLDNRLEVRRNPVVHADEPTNALVLRRIVVNGVQKVVPALPLIWSNRPHDHMH